MTLSFHDNSDFDYATMKKWMFILLLSSIYPKDSSKLLHIVREFLWMYIFPYKYREMLLLEHFILHWPHYLSSLSPPHQPRNNHHHWHNPSFHEHYCKNKSIINSEVWILTEVLVVEKCFQLVYYLIFVVELILRASICRCHIFW